MRSPRPLVTPQVVSSEPVDRTDPPLSAKPVDLEQTVLGRLAAEDDAPFATQPAAERQPTIRRSSTDSLLQPPDPLAGAAVEPPDAGTQAKPEPPRRDDPESGSDQAHRDHLTWMDTAEDRAVTAANEAAEAPADAAGESAADEMARAVELQQDLLTVAPEVAGFTFATRFIPCAGISGDFYEFIQLPDGKIGFALGDVSGHGVQAGLIMSMAKKTLEIYAMQGGGPAEVMCRVNDALLRDLAGRLFISLTYAILDPVARRITWVRAGHAPTIRFNHRTGDLVEIRPRGMVVGMKGGAAFRSAIEEETTSVEAGDTFLLYTDGITETMNSQLEEYGVERLRDIVRQCAGQGPEALVTQILDRVRHFRGARSEADDMTLLAFSAA
jgi:sigma-B regulation protein RsbU (phosphoserine phosphatase)